MSTSTRAEAKEPSFSMLNTLWGEIQDEQQPERKREDDTVGEESEHREEPMEDEDEDDDDDDDEDDDPEECSVEEESSAESGVSAGSQDEDRGTFEQPPPSVSDLPMEIESIIRTAYKREGPKVVFPYRIPPDDDAKETEEVPYEYCRANDIVHHTIRLNQHFRIMSALLRIAQNTKTTEFRKFPPIPDMVIRKRKVKHFKKFKFSVPIYQHPKPYLEKKTIQKMLQKSVVIILAQLGVDKATKSVVLVLVDIVKEFLRNMCLTCNAYCQWDLTRGHMDFRAVMHRTLVDMGLRRGQEDIKDYCESLVKIRNKAFRKTFHLVRLYLKTVYAARMRARLLGAPASRTPSRPHNARTMLPQQGLSVYLPRGMQTITVMERGRPYVRKYQNFQPTAPAPILASKFLANYAFKKKDPPPQLSAILRPTDTSNQ
ncbi:uncharacterized protein [Rhodnius prolixus]|uniref:Uncharacterized protein n=1 Tax=Rhodnius prolixus TaxID=13249 RepID=T1HT66_RHOPR